MVKDLTVSNVERQNVLFSHTFSRHDKDKFIWLCRGEKRFPNLHPLARNNTSSLFPS